MNPQKVNISQDHAYCQKCHADILDIINFRYGGKIILEPTFREELCECRHCGTPFVIRYDLFDEDGHIEPRVFTGDSNDPEYNWQEKLSENQKEVIACHLRGCKECQERLEAEMLTDAWFASIIHQGGKNHAKRNFFRNRND